MVEQSVETSRNMHWIWWLAVALLVVALIFDLIDGAPLKTATSGLLLVACLVGASSRPPRATLVKFAITACMAAAVGLVLYRIAGPGL